MRLVEIVRALDRACPERLAAEWDNVGLHVGDPEAEIRRVVVALDPDLETIERAHDEGAQLLVTHHPLFRTPPARLLENDPDALRVILAVREDLAVYSMHTNFDSLEGGVNDVLAERLGLEGTSVLSPEGGLKKLVVFVPEDSSERVSQAMAAEGAGRIGDYTACSFRTAGTGAFTAPEGAHPAVGEAGQANEAQELRLEMTVPAERLAQVVAAMKSVHPYEEVAYDVYSLEGSRTEVGFGRVGTLPERMTLEAFAALCGERLGIETVRYAGSAESIVSTVAVCGGSGGKLAGAALSRGAQVLVAGDIGYHDAQRALALGVAVVDAGHDGTEAPAVEVLARLVADALKAAGFDGQVGAYEKIKGIWKAARPSSG